MKYAQWFIAIALGISFFVNLYRDVNGRPAKEPKGFEGIVSTVISTAIIVVIYYLAGAFNTLF